MPTAPHPIHRRYYAEDLVRLRRSSEKRRYAASQRLGRIDANPHEIDAVMFALRRILRIPDDLEHGFQGNVNTNSGNLNTDSGDVEHGFRDVEHRFRGT